MTALWAARLDEGYLFGGLSSIVLETLKGVPMLLESSDVRVRKRLLPETCENPEDEAQWRRHSVPELERLFLSRAQLIRRDLGGMKKLEFDGSSALLIPHEHTSAWLTAMNAARLALFALNDLEAHHLDPEEFEALSPKQQEAVIRMDLLAWIQGVLLGEFEIEDGGSMSDFAIE